MNTEKKPGKFQVIFRFLKGSFYLFVLSLVFSVLFTACNALTPQIIRYAVDHILTGVGDSYGRHLLFLAAGAVLVAAILSGIFNYFSKMTLAKGSENFMKNIRDTLFHHIEKLPFACASSDRRDHPTLYLRRGGDPKLRLQPDAGCVPNRFPDGSVPGNHVFHERETLSGGGCFYPGHRGLFRFLLFQDRRPVHEGR